jgi:hypothetical protein
VIAHVNTQVQRACIVHLVLCPRERVISTARLAAWTKYEKCERAQLARGSDVLLGLVVGGEAASGLWGADPTAACFSNR